MAFFDKVTKAAANVGSNIGVAAHDKTELTNLKMQVNAIEQELTASYIQIGRRYVDYVIASGEMPGIDVSDLLKLMDPKLEQKAKLEKEIIELEKKMKNAAVLKEKQAAEAEFLQEKGKLDKALAMDIISQDEYDVKLAAAQKKMNNFEALRKVEQQFEMKLITREERDAKIRELTM